MTSQSIQISSRNIVRSTTKRCRFFDSFDNLEEGESLRSLCRRLDFDLPPPTARRWIKQREELGDKALRRTRKLSTRLGPKKQVCEADLDGITNPKDLIHNLPYKDQIEQLEIGVTPRTLRRHLAPRHAYRRKKRRSKPISAKNKRRRIGYGLVHEKDTITGFWQWVNFTDEAHFNSKELANKAEYELVVDGQREEGESHTQEEKGEEVLDISVHVAAGITYNAKGAFIFYQDPQDLQRS